MKLSPPCGRGFVAALKKKDERKEGREGSCVVKGRRLSPVTGPFHVDKSKTHYSSPPSWRPASSEG